MSNPANTNWNTKNEAAQKQPKYAVSIDGGTVWYHDYPITGSTGNHYKYLTSISGITTTFNPIRSEASIGGVNFELLNSADIWDFSNLYLQQVIIMAGYGDLDWSDYIPLNSNLFIQNFNIVNNLKIKINAQDIQKQTDRDIFSRKVYVAGTVTTATATTLVDTARFQQSDEPDDFWNDGLVVIVGGTGIGQSRTVTDFDSSFSLLTISPAWTTNPDSTSTYKLIHKDGMQLNKNIITFYLQLMTSIAGDTTNGIYDVLPTGIGLGIDEALIDITEIELIRDDFYPLTKGSWYFIEAENAKNFFQENIFRSFAITRVIKSNGLISLRPFSPGLYGYYSANGMGGTMSDSEFIEIPQTEIKYEDIVNRVIFKYDWDWLDQEFDSETTFNHAASQALYGVNAITIESKSIKTANDAVNLLQIIADKYFTQFADFPVMISVVTKFSKRIIEAADQILINSSQIANVNDESYTWTNRLAEVWRVAPDFKNGNMKFELKDLSTSGLEYRVIGPSSLVADYPDQTAEEQAKYCSIGVGHYIHP